MNDRVMSGQPEPPAGFKYADNPSMSSIIPLEKFSKPFDPPMTKNNADYSTEMNRWFLRPIGIWPIGPQAGIIPKIVNYLQIVICQFLICFLIVPCGLHTFLEEKDSALRLKMIGPLSFCFMAITKYCFLLLRRDDIYGCIKHIERDWSTIGRSKDRETMVEVAKFGRFIVVVCAVFMYGGGFFYHTIMPLTCGFVIETSNVSMRTLVYPFYDAVLDATRSPTYEIVFVTQWFSGFVMYTITIGACGMAAVFAMHACGQFKILVDRLDRLVDGDDNDDTVDQRMADIVELHLRALGFIARVETILNEVCLIEFVGCTMNICFLGYYFMTEWERSEAISTVTYCVLLVSFTFNILIFCYIGEMLTEESKRVGTVTYMIDWYRLEGSKARGLIMVLVMSKNPASITAGKMAELSLSSFCGVLRTALTYLNLLRQVAS